ncbi:uncharacterized protein CHAB577_0177 [Chlamydia abortus]|nr:uncharacterized protein CHAB577_0177 [Chlamydia abortus]
MFYASVKIGRPQLVRSSIPVDYTPGKVYDLEKIYQDLNLRLFEGSLDLHIGWFGRQRCQVVRLGRF